MNRQEFEIESLGIRYALERNMEGSIVVLSEDDFEKLFQTIRQLQGEIAQLQDQLLTELQKQALIKNILSH